MLIRASLRCLHISAAACARHRGTVAPKAMGKNVYAVVTGRKPGLYTSWEQCLLQVKGFPGNRYKGFANEQEALQYLRDNGVAAAGVPPAAAATGGGEAAAAHKAAAGMAAPRKRHASDKGVSAKRQQQKTVAAAPAAAAAVADAVWTAQELSAASGGSGLQATGRVLRLEFDGASKGNPGLAGFGAVLYDDATGVEVARLCQYMGDTHTNNQAEYAGLIAGLQAALELGCARIKVQGDSTLIIRQVLGEWQVKNEGLRPYHAAATALRHRFASFEARQVLREFNKAADALSNQAIDDYRMGVNRRLWRLQDAVAAHQAAVADGGAAAEAAVPAGQGVAAAEPAAAQPAVAASAGAAAAIEEGAGLEQSEVAALEDAAAGAASQGGDSGEGGSGSDDSGGKKKSKRARRS